MDEDEMRRALDELRGEQHDHYCLTHGEWGGCTDKFCEDTRVSNCPRDDHPEIGRA